MKSFKYKYRCCLYIKFRGKWNVSGTFYEANDFSGRNAFAHLILNNEHSVTKKINESWVISFYISISNIINLRLG